MRHALPSFDGAFGRSFVGKVFGDPGQGNPAVLDDHANLGATDSWIALELRKDIGS
jgi:hypothetical protein